MDPIDCILLYIYLKCSIIIIYIKLGSDNMRQISIKMTDSKDLIASIKNLGNKYDNEVTSLTFVISDLYNNIQYKYLKMINNTNSVLYKLDTNNTCVIKNDVSKIAGNWILILILSSSEITNDDINNDSIVAVSNELVCEIYDNFL